MKQQLFPMVVDAPNPIDRPCRVTVPPSKSLMHRIMIGTALCGEPQSLPDNMLSEDLKATEACLFRWRAGTKIGARHKTFDCRDSASTLRLLLPLLASDAEKTRITGSAQLAERPFTVYHRLLSEQGFSLSYEKKTKQLPVVLTGQLHSGTFFLPGDISSQFISGLLMALPLLEGDSRIVLTTPLESAPYVAMTISVLDRFGIVIHQEKNGYSISGGQLYCPPERLYASEGDYSHAAFWLVMGTLLPGNDQGMIVRNLPESSLQGDRAIIPFLREMGADPIRKRCGWMIKKASLHGVTIDLRHCPDLLPPLAVAALGAEGETVFTGGKRLRYKESDRLAAVAEMIRTLGGHIMETGDGLIISGGRPLKGGPVHTRGDHRIAMAAAVASVLCQESVMLDDGDCVKKSYPDFWKVWRRIGGKAHGICLGSST